jgi:hypothetical protein
MVTIKIQVSTDFMPSQIVAPTALIQLTCSGSSPASEMKSELLLLLSLKTCYSARMSSAFG